MSPDRLLDMVGRPGGPLADAALWNLEVTASGPVSPNVHRITFTGSELAGLRYQAGQDLMLRVPDGGGGVTNRRYTIRMFDPAVPSVTVDASLHGSGPGTAWMQSARPGDSIDAIGPRGKVTLREDADWHLFVADETGMPGALAMIGTLASEVPAIAFLEVDLPEDEQSLDDGGSHRRDVLWLHRNGRSNPGDPDALSAAVSRCALPSGRGHAYVAAEKGVVRAVETLLLQLGLDASQISAKAYWRRDAPNADHGEPAREG